jgi:hypothetical protein
MPSVPTQRIEDLDGPPVIGVFYDVPCVLWKQHAERSAWVMPIIGPRHEDAEFLNFEHDHYHFDWRFTARPYYESIASHTRPRTGTVHARVAAYSYPQSVVGGSTSEPFRRRLRCKREMPEWPVVHHVHFAMENAFEGCVLKPGKICPHRGFDLSGVKPNESGQIVCPGHGLAFDKTTGCLVRRTHRPEPTL